MWRIILVSLLALPVIACSSGPGWQAPPARESLVPHIQADGTKFFVFQRDYLRADPRRPGSDVIGEFQVNERLALIMQATGYCREGFFELYREQTFQSFSVRGECREDATELDREQFQQPIILD